MKNFIRKILPAGIRQVAGRTLGAMRARRMAQLGVADAFDEIYRKGYWQQGSSLSGVGSEGEWVEKYCDLVRELAIRLDLRTAVDAGCGDFNVGRELAAHFREYVALDVSAFIIARNKAAYARLGNVRFSVCNLIEDVVPRTDLIMVRQVLQHLSNQQISAILANIRNSGSRYLLIAEEQPSDRKFLPNADLGSHSVLTRLEVGSAVDISAPPFNLAATLIGRLPAAGDNPTTTLALYLVDLQ